MVLRYGHQSISKSEFTKPRNGGATCLYNLTHSWWKVPRGRRWLGLLFNFVNKLRQSQGPRIFLTHFCRLKTMDFNCEPTGWGIVCCAPLYRWFRQSIVWLVEWLDDWDYDTASCNSDQWLPRSTVWMCTARCTQLAPSRGGWNSYTK